MSKIESQAEREAQLKRRSDFLGGNVVKSTIVNPLNVTKRIPNSLMSEVFAIDKVHVTYDRMTTTVPRTSLEPTLEKDLPIGVYAALSLRKSDPKHNPPLPIGAQLTVEYVGRMCLTARLDSIGLTYRGLMDFPPSDVIANQYRLKPAYPSEVELNGKHVDLTVDTEHSGSRFLHNSLQISRR